jgi:hypothetical protein
VTSILTLGRQAAESILADYFHVEVRKALNPLNPHDFATLTRQLGALLAGHVEPAETKAVQKAVDALDIDWKGIPKEARWKLIDHVRATYLDPIVEKVMPKIDQTVSFYAKDIVQSSKAKTIEKFDLKVDSTLNGFDRRVLTYAEKSQGHFIRNRFGERADRFALRARSIVSSGLEQGLGSSEIAEKLHTDLAPAGRGRGYWDMIAMVFANRARTMAQLGSFHEAGIVAYQWESVMDEVTSVQCRFLHGRHFPVRTAMEHFDQVEALDNPEDIKTTTPFVNFGMVDGKPSLYVGGRGSDERTVVAHVTRNAVGTKDDAGGFANAKGNDALLALGISAPPIHGRCRSTIVPEMGSLEHPQPRGGAPVPPEPMPEAVTPPKKPTPREAALARLAALPDDGAGYIEDTNGLLRLDRHDDPDKAFLSRHDNEEIDTAFALRGEKQKVKVADLTSAVNAFDRDVVADLISNPKKLAAATIRIATEGDAKFIVEGHEAVLAHRLLNKREINALVASIKAPAIPIPDKPLKPAEFVPPPPMPRLHRKFDPMTLQLPDEGKKAKEVAEGLAADRKIFEGKSLDDKDRLDIASRKKWKKVRAKRGDDEMVVVPLNVGPPPPIDTYSAAARAGVLDNKTARALPKTRALLSDFVGAEGADKIYKNAVIEHVHALLKHDGHFPDRDDDNPYRDEAPVLVRIGDKLYPWMNGANAQVAAAKSLGMKTIDARIVDANPHMLAQAQAAQAASNAIMAKQAERDRLHAAEVERVRKEVEARQAREAVGSPEVVAVRAKHQPADYAAKHEAVYREAAASIGWGEAMQARGFELPIAHLKTLARPFEKIDGHPLQFMGDSVEAAENAGHSTLGDYAKSLAAKLEGRPADHSIHRADLNATNALAAILGHVDAMQGGSAHETFALGTIAPEVGDQKWIRDRFNWMAQLTSKSVAVPDQVHIGMAIDRRADCNPYEMTRWKGRTALIRIEPDESTGTIFHEMGHAIDGADRGRGVRASAFLDARTAGTKLKSLRDITGWGRADEMTREDEFAHPYIGKDYGREKGNVNEWADDYYGPKAPVDRGGTVTAGVHLASEVTSMAVQWLGDHNNKWKTAMLRDPLHFLFGLGQLGGY